MSTEAAVAPPAAAGRSWRQDLRTVRTLRLALALTAAMAIAQGLDWPLQFVYVALVVGLLADRLDCDD